MMTMVHVAEESPGTRAWVLTDGTVGMEVQCIGLAEVMGLEPEVKRIEVKRPWRWLPATLIQDGLAAVGSGGDPLDPPWPDLLISCGRRAVAPAMAVRRHSNGRTFAVHIQNPLVAPGCFDLVVAPEHDQLEAPNVITTIGALGRVTSDRLSAAARAFKSRYESVPSPRVAVLLGGDSKVHRLSPAVVEELSRGLRALAERHGASLLVTCSRRTGARNRAVLREALADLPGEFWDGEGENPYFALLALADAIVVSSDSVNMVSEAAATGKPVYVVFLEGGSPKFDRFHRSMRMRGITRPFDGSLDFWTYEPLRETHRVVAQVRPLLHRHRIHSQSLQPLQDRS